MSTNRKKIAAIDTTKNTNNEYDDTADLPDHVTFNNSDLTFDK